MRTLRYTPITGRARLVRALASIALFWVLSGCVPGQGPGTPAGHQDAGGPGIDILAETCNPAAQSGCELGEKCASLVEQVHPLLSRTDCVPAGKRALGQACARGPEGPDGYDDCAAGLSCLDGLCAAICKTEPVDTCRAAREGFGEGSYCTVFANLFSETTGLCVPGCDPADDESCEHGFGCYLNADRGVASCAAVPPAARSLAQNAECHGPASGDCFVNGCSPGHSPLLANKTTNADAALCSRYCTPAESHAGSTGEVAGAFGNCSDLSLAQSGGTGGNASPHQCRFLQSFYDNTDSLPVDLGMCVPVQPLAGGTWSDCREFDWDGIGQRWHTAVLEGSDPVAAFRAHCLATPADPSRSAVFDHCLGLFRGCVSLGEVDEVLQIPTGGALLSRRSWIESLDPGRPSLEANALEAWQNQD